jgi:hypothetical protein
MLTLIKSDGRMTDMDPGSKHHDGFWNYERYDASTDKKVYVKTRKFISTYLDEPDMNISFEVSKNFDGTND